ncbi:MAG: peptide-methionine (S)-S-oxide reductase MsrA [Bdellovibrionales bacterium]|nr:peptide-methionine (S)-S-oxide reductase MsrA [Bdellovibrionales bacterium]
MEVAILAAGCFWGVENILRSLPGVVSTTVGYTGGDLKNPKYSHVKTGETGHAEAVRIEFDPAKLTYENLLDLFFRLHDPTQLNRQMNDVGTQYRSAIFYLSETQKEIAEKKRGEVEASGKWKKPIATLIVPAVPFWPAEDEHQDYLQKNPNGYNCHWVRD